VNYAEHIANLEATREAKAKRMKEIQQKAMDEGRSKDQGEKEEFDTISDEIKALDADLADVRKLKALEDADKSTAKPVDGSAKAKAKASETGIKTLQVKDTTKLEPGLSFARHARVKALAHLGMVGGLRDELSVAKRVYPDDANLIETIEKGNVVAANTLTGSSTWAGNLINEGGVAFADFVEYLRPRTLLGQISDRLRRLPFDTPVLVQGSAGSAGWVKEGAAKPLTQWTYTRTKLAPLKVAAIAAATKETLMRASIAADTLLRDELARSVAQAIDSKFISDDASVTDESPAGILTNGTQVSVSGGTTVADIRCDIAAFLTAFAEDNLSLAGSFWVMSERTAIALSLVANEVGNAAFPGVTPTGGTFAGLPVFVSGNVPNDSTGSVVALVKGDEIFLGDEGGVQVSMSDQASLLMTDDANANHDSTTPTPTTVVSMFQTNSVAFLVERFINFQKRRNAAVAYATVGWTACNPNS
jgi:DNA-binding transcriptional regulator YdaS (Cro superfamily)